MKRRRVHLRKLLPGTSDPILARHVQEPKGGPPKKRRRVRLKRYVPLALLLIPPLFWGAILTITPTEWARTRIVSRLSEESRRSIRVGGLKIGVFGGIYLLDLEIGASGEGQEPWLKAAYAQIDVSVLQLLAGQMEPSKIWVTGLDLRILRRSDGSLELADLLGPPPARPAHSTAGDETGPAPLEFELRGGQVKIVDEPSHTHLNLTKIQGHATWQGRQLTIQNLQGTLNGGVVELALALDRSRSEPNFEVRCRAQGVELDRETSALNYLLPILAGTDDAGALEGQLNAHFYCKGQGITRAALNRSLVGQGNILVDSIALQRSRFYQELRRQVDLPDNLQVGSLKSDFAIKGGRIQSDNLTLDVGQVPIVLAGWTGFDGRLDYRVRTEGLADKLSDQAREWLGELSIDTTSFSSLRLTGTLDAMHVSVGAGASLANQGSESERGTEREKIRELGRRVRNRILR